VLRTCLSLSAITGRPVEIANIRGGRAKPGMQAQHLACVEAAAQICGAAVTGANEGSLYLLFEPAHKPRAGDYAFDIGTAGSAILVAQTLIVPLSHCNERSRLVIRGGTHNPMAPTADYLEHVYAATLREFGYRFRSSFDPPGFYPRGGGELRVEIEPVEASDAISFTPLTSRAEFTARIVLCDLPANIGDRAEKLIRSALPGIRVARVGASGHSTGAAVTIATHHAGFSSLGAKGKPMESVAQEAIDEARLWIEGDADVDEHLADQLVLPALMARGTSRWKARRITEHLRTVLWVAAQFRDVESNVDESSRAVVIQVRDV